MDVLSPNVSDDKLCEEGTRVVKSAQEKNIPLRTMGALATRTHCLKYRLTLDKLQRRLTDLDFVSYSKYNSKVYDFFTENGYVADQSIFRYFGNVRHIYYEKDKRWHADVFFDMLRMNHVVDFRGRLELDFPTITLADLLLEKMQIVQINEKDIKDTCALLLEHNVGDKEDMIDGNYIAKVLSRDWGFQYTVTTNLSKVTSYRPSVLSEEDHVNISTKIGELLALIEREPKSLKWKMRARQGPAKKWYQDVESLE
jgi:hypothetical protein